MVILATSICGTVNEGECRAVAEGPVLAAIAGTAVARCAWFGDTVLGDTVLGDTVLGDTVLAVAELVVRAACRGSATLATPARVAELRGPVTRDEFPRAICVPWVTECALWRAMVLPVPAPCSASRVVKARTTATSRPSASQVAASVARRGASECAARVAPTWGSRASNVVRSATDAAGQEPIRADAARG